MQHKIEPDLYIDLDKNIRESNSAFLKKMPQFVINLLKRIVMQQEFNVLLTSLGDVKGNAFLNGTLQKLNITVKIHGIENLPENGRCIFAANHPFGVIDGLILTHTVSTKYGTLRAIANDAFNLIPQLNEFITDVNVYGTSSKEKISALNAIYDSAHAITHFPSGEVSRVYDGKVQDTIWQKSFIKKAVESKRDIVPFHFHGENSKLFYFLFKIRKSLGLKMNIELMLLPREFFNKKNQTIELTIGKPIAYTTFDKSKSHQEWANHVKESVYGLPRL
jgi:putative hemolysin